MFSAVIITSILVEYSAVRIHLTDLKEEIHPKGKIYERGKFSAYDQEWEVGIVEVGAGNSSAALEAERAIAYFNPDVILFVGVAGGIKDVKLGDVVAATKVYGYESGKQEEIFRPRPDVGLSTYDMIQRAIVESRKEDWWKRCQSSAKPNVLVAPIASGDKIVANKESDLLKFLRNNYGDAVAVEMEGKGILKAAHANQQVSALIIRGISNLIDGKDEADQQGYQEIAASHASAFAFEILAKLKINETNFLALSAFDELEPNILDRKLYLNRPKIETICQREIQKPSGFLRIKASCQMGKTSLLKEIISIAKKNNYLTVYIPLRIAHKRKAVLDQLDKFLIWFCERITKELNKQGININSFTQTTENDLFDIKYRCSDFFIENILPQINRPLIICLDDIDHFYKTDIADDFFDLLRQFHEESKIYDIWQKIRLIITYSNSRVIYDNEKKIFTSPLNVGRQIQLMDFDSEEILKLAQNYNININNNEITKLKEIIAGYPHLLQIVFEEIYTQKISVKEFIDLLLHNPETYEPLLLQNLAHLEQNLKLKEAMKIIVHSANPVQLNLSQTFDLESMGLIKRINNHAVIRCQLYRQYFRKYL